MVYIVVMDILLGLGSSSTKPCPMDTHPVLDTPLGMTTQPDTSYVSTFFAGSDQPVTNGNTPPTDAIWAGSLL